MALDEKTEALLEGASALRYKAERLAGLIGDDDDNEHWTLIELWRMQAEILAALAAERPVA